MKKRLAVSEETFKAGAQVVQARLAMWGDNKAVFGTAAITYEPNLAKLTIMG
jgi:hypothetical protein